ncbi:OLC1v1009787C1 [Oldenlandia corymbosa var. corymbosa]|uniref:OLC1v1009787C1 n=1 Tax=Oldenlandia corymbosa var. corymbosa TaxID=529605 RepID=A0AAV1DS53_OLDCO|nr:OLC1v1009787C1 [Oldenlandia corymbosa var. corymbosa]
MCSLFVINFDSWCLFPLLPLFSQKCSKRAVRQAYHNLCTACAKENNVCAKCSCRVGHIVGRDVSEVEAERKRLEEAINNARERDRRTLLRTMNKAKPQGPPKLPSNEDSKVGDLFTASSIEEYAKVSRHGHNDDYDEDDDDISHHEKEEEDGDDNSIGEEDGHDNSDDEEDGDDNSTGEGAEDPSTHVK